MGKVKRLELWWQLYRTSLPVRDLEISDRWIFAEQSVPIYICTQYQNSRSRQSASQPRFNRRDPEYKWEALHLEPTFSHFVTNITTCNLHAEFRPGLNTKIHRFEIPFSLTYLICSNSIRPELGNIWSTRSVITALSALLTVLASTVHYITYCRIPKWEVMQLTSRHKQ